MRQLFLIYAFLFILSTLNVFAQTILINYQVKPNLQEDHSCLCFIPAVGVYLASQYSDDIFLNLDNFEDTSTSFYSAMTDLNGEFSLSIPDTFLNDSLVFVHWSYKTKVVPIRELQKPYRGSITLDYQKILLPAVIINSFRKKKLSEELIDQYTLLKDFETNPFSEFIPVFHGDNKNFGEYIIKRIREGRIRIKEPLIVEFTVDYRGEIKNVDVLSESCNARNKEIKQIFEQSPRWTPGRARGPRLNYRFALPIVFDVVNEN